MQMSVIRIITTVTQIGPTSFSISDNTIILHQYLHPNNLQKYLTPQQFLALSHTHPFHWSTGTGYGSRMEDVAHRVITPISQHRTIHSVVQKKIIFFISPS
jgi:hypothetical protein